MAIERRGFTLVESLVAFSAIVVVLGALFAFSRHINRGYSKTEASAEVLSEAGLFMAALRHDLVNAVAPEGTLPGGWRQVITASPERLTYHVYVDEQGTIAPVDWERSGMRVSRVSGGKSKAYITGALASLTWQVGCDVVSGGIGSGSRQLWLEVALVMGGGADGKGALGAAPVAVTTRIFPRRLNRQIEASGRGL